MDCYKCSTPLPDGAHYCLACGADVSAGGGVSASSLSAEAVDALLVSLRDAVGKDFVILRELGRGGMAAVFLATEVALARSVAIKVLPPELTFGSGFTERFTREAQTAAALDHPHIIPIFRIATSGKLLWYAMKYVEGTDLARVLHATPVLPLGRALRYLRPIGRALDFAHRKNVVHRDVKPANVMVTHDGHIYVTDFGIAKALDSSSLTGSGGLIGTPYYMAPEQCRGRRVTPLVDQYALGVMTYQMVSGQLPFDGDSAVEILTKHVSEPPPPLEILRPGLPARVGSVISRAMAKNPAQRFPSVVAFTQALEEASLQPASSGRHSSRATVVNSTRVPRVARQATLGPLVAILLVAFVTVAAGGYYWLTRPRDTLISQGRGVVRPHDPGRVEGSIPVSPQADSETSSRTPRTTLLRFRPEPSQAVISGATGALIGDSLRVEQGSFAFRLSAPGYRDTVVRISSQGRGDTLSLPVRMVLLDQPSVAQDEPATPTQSVSESAPSPSHVTGILRVVGRPFRARVKIGAIILGTMPLMVDTIPAGRLSISIEAEGFDPRVISVVIRPAPDTTLVHVTLTRRQ